MKVMSKGEYNEVINRYFHNGFPKVATVKGEDVVDILTSVLVGSKETRYGPSPKAEGLVTVRKTIRSAVEMGLPIPILIPWGGRKMDKNLSLDVAEVSALKQLLCIDEQVKKFYAPGLLMNIRIEDVNARWLYKEDEGIDDYSGGMVDLIELLSGDSLMFGIRESSLMDLDLYMQISEEYAELLAKVITAQMAMPSLDVNTIPEYTELVKRGWQGLIPDEQRSYYLDRYVRMDPDGSIDSHISKLADYFAGSKTRYDLKGKANPETPVGSFIQINFSPKVPGAPNSLFNNTLYYRTVPESSGRTHVAPWRGKGYLELLDGDVAISKMVNTGIEAPKFTRDSVTLTSNDEKISVLIRADYVYRPTLIGNGLYPAII
jgi:hypothetical protein